MDYFYQSFIEMMAIWLATKCHISWPWNVGRCHQLQKPLYLGYYTAEFNQTFTKIMQLGLATKAWHQLALKMQGKVTLSNISYCQTDLNQIFFKNNDATTGIVVYRPSFLYPRQLPPLHGCTPKTSRIFAVFHLL